MSILSIEQLDVLLVEPSSTQRRIIEDYLTRLGAGHLKWVENGEQRQRVRDVVCSNGHGPGSGHAQ